MGKPFQFSIRWAIAGIAFFSVDAWLLARLQREPHAVHRWSPDSAITFGSITGAAIGCFLGRPLGGLLMGLFLGAAVYFALGFFTGFR